MNTDEFNELKTGDIVEYYVPNTYTHSGYVKEVYENEIEVEPTPKIVHKSCVNKKMIFQSGVSK